MSFPGGVPPCTRTLKPKHGSTYPAGQPLKPSPHAAQAQAQTPESQLWTSEDGRDTGSWQGKWARALPFLNSG